MLRQELSDDGATWELNQTLWEHPTRDSWTPGGPQNSWDKQFVRDWSLRSGWDKTYPGPEIPAEVVEKTRDLYIDVYQRITGNHW